MLHLPCGLEALICPDSQSQSLRVGVLQYYSLLHVPSREGTGYILQIYYSLLLVPSRESEGGYGIYTTDLFTFWTLIEGRAHIVHKFVADIRSVS